MTMCGTRWRACVDMPLIPAGTVLTVTRHNHGHGVVTLEDSQGHRTTYAIGKLLDHCTEIYPATCGAAVGRAWLRGPRRSNTLTVVFRQRNRFTGDIAIMVQRRHGEAWWRTTTRELLATGWQPVRTDR